MLLERELNSSSWNKMQLLGGHFTDQGHHPESTEEPGYHHGRDCGGLPPVGVGWKMPFNHRKCMRPEHRSAGRQKG